jgi:hypothetical protein
VWAFVVSWRIFSQEVSMSSDLKADALEAVAGAANPMSGIGSVLEWVKKAVVEVGCQYQAQILEAADYAIDTALAVDLPYLPPVVEEPLDVVLAKLGKAWVRSAVQQVCGS